MRKHATINNFFTFLESAQIGLHGAVIDFEI